MQYNNIKKVSYYQTNYNGNYNFAIGQSEKCYYAIIVNENNIFTEKTNSIAVAKQILLNHLYKYIHKDAQEFKYNNKKLEEIELTKTIKTNEIVNFIY